ncbi:MAG TPA: hypothetical protein VJT67_07355 [Longimicrobiaceae bacterium]|nr:hypothetical protein [Longimicrobiaceae bacterium]
MATTLAPNDLPDAVDLLDPTPPTPPANPLPADALALRLVSDWASGTRGTELWFTCSESFAWMVPPGQTPLTPVETTPNEIQIYPLASITLSVASPTGISSTTLYAPGTPDVPQEQIAHALLWSEGAVEKFLLPYLASIGGWEAPGLLQQVAQAWYGYDGTVVQVVALALTLSPAPTATGSPLGVGTSISVVYAPVSGGQTGALAVASLDRFTANTGFFGAGRGPAQPLSIPPGSLGSITLSTNGQLDTFTARELAEFAGGNRGQALYLSLVTDDGGTRPQLVVNACPGPQPCGTEEQQAIYTALVRPDRPAPSGVVADVTGAESLTLVGPGSDFTPTPPDSIFWTDAAIERLMIPYYCSVKGIQSPLFITHLIGKWNGMIAANSPVGMQNLFQVLQGLDDQVVQDTPPIPESEVFGLVHLPRSEYVPESGVEPPAFNLDQRLLLLSYDGQHFHRNHVV